MSLKLAAEHLKNQGRNSDTELVHMTKGEVRGLQALAKSHGGSLTINPETGLPEAGFLSGILPMIAGAAAIALAPETGGASLALEPWMVGAGIGAADWALTGNLKQGIMAGLGAYGGASLASGLAASGAATAAGEAGSATTAAANEAGRQAAEMAASQGASKAAQEAARQAAMDEASQQVTKQAMQQAMPGTISNIGTGLKAAAAAPGAFIGNNMGAIGAAAAPMLTGAMNAPQNPQLAAAQQKNPMGLKTISPDFQGAFPTQPNPHYQAQYTDYTKNPYNPTAMAAGGIAQAPTQDKNFAAGGMYPMSQQDHTQYASSPQTPISMQATMASYDPETNPLTGEPTTHMASGGIASYAGKSGSLVDALNAYNSATSSGIKELPRSSGVDAGIYTDTDPNTRNLDAYGAALYNLKKRASKAGMGKNAVVLKEAKQLGDIEEDAAGGLMAGHGLGGYSDGGRLLKGPGDGMSDSIPAQIGKRQPARLADGEFVVPADVVSHLGNGSTEAGAKKLHGMMDKVRMDRTGKKKQAPAVKAGKYIPK